MKQIGLFLTVAVLAAGCATGKALTAEDFGYIRPGYRTDTVREQLGEPLSVRYAAKLEGGSQPVIWAYEVPRTMTTPWRTDPTDLEQKESLRYEVTFVDGVVTKVWHEP